MAFASVLVAVWGLYLGLVCSREIFRCFGDQDCPPGALCYKDECPRCLCRNGTVLDKLYDGGILTEICNKRFDYHPRVGDACEADDQCPYNSLCHQGACICKGGMVPDVRHGSHCRLSGYGEHCDISLPCDDRLGFVCFFPRNGETEKGKNNTFSTVHGVCRCKSSHHRPTAWSRFVLGRWNYAVVEGSPQECVARAVGEPCVSDEECAAVQGSGAICGHCGYCECRRDSHVPDILGTKCGPGHLLGQKCSLQSRYVCDGTLGLQCGDVCDIYASSYAFKRKHCTCSQMHNRIGSSCISKIIGSECTTDLDCFPITEGFGYCDKERCLSNGTSSPPGYVPYTVDKECLLQILPRHPSERPRSPPSDTKHPNGSSTVDYTIQQNSTHLERNSPSRESLEPHIVAKTVTDSANTIRGFASLCIFTLGIVHSFCT